jgi:hypothetical protein
MHSKALARKEMDSNPQIETDATVPPVSGQPRSVQNEDLAGSALRDDQRIRPAPETAVPPQKKNNVYFRICPNSNAVIVFIHGILSDSRGCWSRQTAKGTVYWPALICTDPYFNGISIFLAGYQASMDSGQAGVRQAAELVMSALRFQRGPKPPLDYEKIVFVCHSTGGLVA